MGASFSFQASEIPDLVQITSGVPLAFTESYGWSSANSLTFGIIATVSNNDNLGAIPVFTFPVSGSASTVLCTPYNNGVLPEEGAETTNLNCAIPVTSIVPGTVTAIFEWAGGESTYTQSYAFSVDTLTTVTATPAAVTVTVTEPGATVTPTPVTSTVINDPVTVTPTTTLTGALNTVYTGCTTTTTTTTTTTITTPSTSTTTTTTTPSTSTTATTTSPSTTGTTPSSSSWGGYNSTTSTTSWPASISAGETADWQSWNSYDGSDYDITAYVTTTRYHTTCPCLASAKPSWVNHEKRLTDNTIPYNAPQYTFNALSTNTVIVTGSTSTETDTTTADPVTLTAVTSTVTQSPTVTATTTVTVDDRTVATVSGCSPTAITTT